jgi:phage shock protein B
MGELGVLIPIMIFAIPLLAIWTSHQRKMMEHRPPQDDAQVHQLVNQVEALQDRVQVLERIVTDQGYSVASQIEALRVGTRDKDTALPEIDRQR